MTLPRLSPGIGAPSATKDAPDDPPPTRGPGGRLSPGPSGGVGADDDEEDDDEDDGPDEEDRRTIEELRKTGDPNAVDRTPVLESGDLDVRTDEWPLGFPLQGIPRIAAVLNLNYVYNETRGEWQRQTPSTGGGGTVSVEKDVELLVETEMSGQSTVDISSAITSEYGVYRVYINYVTVPNLNELAVQMRQQGSSSFDSDDNNYDSENGFDSSLGADLVSTTGPEMSADLTIYDPLNSSTHTEVNGTITHADEGVGNRVGVSYIPTAAVDGIRFNGSDNGTAVDFTSGTLRVYGHRSL